MDENTDDEREGGGEGGGEAGDGDNGGSSDVSFSNQFKFMVSRTCYELCENLVTLILWNVRLCQT